MIQSILGNFEYSQPENVRVYHVIGLSLFIIFPICIVKSTKAWSCSPIITFAYITYCSFVLIIEVFIYWSYGVEYDKVVYFKVDLNFFDAFGAIFFAFMSQPNFYSSISDLGKNDLIHQKKVSLMY